MGHRTFPGPPKEKAMHRVPVRKHKSARKFNKQVTSTKRINMKAAPMRGGIRL